MAPLTTATSSPKAYTLITGGSHGIGRALAEECARHGESLILVARNETQLREVQQKLQSTYDVSVIPICLDLTLPGAVAKLAEKVHHMQIEVHTLINNAGFGDYGPFVQADRTKILSMIDLNVRALTELCHEFAPKMQQRKRGKILNVASIAGFLPGPFMAVYFATKAYVLSFSEALAEELRENGITVTTLCPGPTRTEFAQQAGAQKTKMFQNAETAESIAALGYHALQQGQRITLPQWRYRFMIPFTRLFPSEWLTRLLRSTNH